MLQVMGFENLCIYLLWLEVAIWEIGMIKFGLYHGSYATDTLNSFPKGAIYKVFGGPNQHYGHYDLLCGRTVRCLTLPL